MELYCNSEQQGNKVKQHHVRNVYKKNPKQTNKQTKVEKQTNRDKVSCPAGDVHSAPPYAYDVNELSATNL